MESTHEIVCEAIRRSRAMMPEVPSILEAGRTLEGALLFHAPSHKQRNMSKLAHRFSSVPYIGMVIAFLFVVAMIGLAVIDTDSPLPDDAGRPYWIYPALAAAVQLVSMFFVFLLAGASYDEHEWILVERDKVTLLKTNPKREVERQEIHRRSLRRVLAAGKHGLLFVAATATKPPKVSEFQAMKGYTAGEVDWMARLIRKEFKLPQ